MDKLLCLLDPLIELVSSGFNVLLAEKYVDLMPFTLNLY